MNVLFIKTFGDIEKQHVICYKGVKQTSIKNTIKTHFSMGRNTVVEWLSLMTFRERRTSRSMQSI